jgi:hypothetical protein
LLHQLTVQSLESRLCEWSQAKDVLGGLKTPQLRKCHLEAKVFQDLFSSICENIEQFVKSKFSIMSTLLDNIQKRTIKLGHKGKKLGFNLYVFSFSCCTISTMAMVLAIRTLSWNKGEQHICHYSFQSKNEIGIILFRYLPLYIILKYIS